MGLEKIRKPVLAGLAVFVLAAFFALPSAEAQDLNRLLTTMDEHRNQLQTLKADLKMTEFEATLRDESEREGEVQYLPQDAQDAFFRIDWESPDDTLIVAAGKYILWRKRLNQYIVGSTEGAAKAKGTNNALKFLGMKKAELKRNYAAAYLGRARLAGQKVTHIKLTPKGADAFTEVQLWVGDDGMPIQSKVKYKNKDETTVRLSRIRENDPIEKANFYPDLSNVIKVKA